MATTIKFFLLVTLPASVMCACCAQSYHAFNGSSFAGVTSMYNNPASIVNQGYKWDVTLFGVQATSTNTAFVVYNNSRGHFNTDSVTGDVSPGGHPRYLHAVTDVNILNARYSINSKNAVAFGLRLRSYNHIKAAPFNYSDTTTTLQSFLHQNNTINYIDGYGVFAGWAEINLAYSRVLFHSSASSLSAGITLSYIKSLSGAYVQLKHASYAELTNNNGDKIYTLTGGGAGIAYSSNYLLTNDNNTTAQNIHNFIKSAPSSFSFDIGAEYLLKNNGDDVPVNALNYDWKIGVSIMDIGHNSFNPIDGSVTLSNPLPFTDAALQKKLTHIHNIMELRDSLSGLFTTATPLTNPFSISMPTRLIISVDHTLGNYFAVNGEVSLNFYSSLPAIKLHTREINLLTIIPRWETQAWGLYLPVQYNTQGLLWVGAAVKLGPLLVGVHNLNIFKWLKAGQQTFNGGAYMLLSIHPYKKPERKISSSDCPVL